MHLKARCFLVAGAFAVSLASAATAAPAKSTSVTCPGPGCSCKTVTVHTCDARPNGSLYNCRDVQETQCTVTSGSAKAVKAPDGGRKTIKVPDTKAPPAAMKHY